MTESAASAPARGVSHVDALPPGSRLAEFEILALLGVGGFGMVYKAFDHSLHRAVAIKEYMPAALAGRAEGQSLWVRSSSDQQTFHAGLASFVGEARLLAQFDHPSLVKVFRFWEANNTAYMVMPLYTGMTLKQARMQMRTPPPELWLRKLLWSALGALRVLHEGKTLHRDISPDNIFLQDNGPPVLLDLGAARHAINDQDRKHTAVLKVNYAPIEQYSEDDDELRQGPWSDLYSLGAVVHGCLANDTPLPATLRAIRDRMVSFSRIARTVKRQFGVEYSAPFVAAISQSLALRPGDRPQNIDAFLQIMEMTSAPEDVEHFDFRAELGDIWVEPADRPGPGLLIPTVDVTSASGIVAEIHAQAQQAQDASGMRTAEEPEADTVMLDAPDTVMSDPGDTVFIDEVDTVAVDDSRYDELVNHWRSDAGGRPAPEPRPLALESDTVRAAARGTAKPAKTARRSPVLVGLAVAVLCVVVAAAGVRWAHSGKGARDDIITEMAEKPAVPSVLESAPANAGAGDAIVSVADVAVAPVSGPPGGGEAPAVAVSVPVPAFVVASQPRAPSRPTKRVAPEPAPTPIVVREEPIPGPPPAPAPKPKPLPARLPSPQEVCADSSFFARPMCIYQECQKPSQAGHSVCVENRRRYEAEAERRRQGGN